MRAVDLEKLLPSDIPPGERVLWHGRPEWVSFARRAYRVDVVGAYFLAMTILNYALTGFEAGVLAGLVAALKTLGAGVAAVMLLFFLAWLSARTTLYVLTTRRLTMKIGVALPIFLNIPYSQIESAALRVHSDETGDIPLALINDQRISYLHLWPHARPFHIVRPQPALRSIRNARAVADTLSAALLAAHPGARAEAATRDEPRAEAAPAGARSAAA